VIASQPEAYQLGGAVEFSRLYVPVIALALLLAVWFTVRQTRNIVEPVERLAQRARGIESRDFETRLDLKREDELGELAGAFDRMAQRLGRQFASLTTLAEMDRLILSGAQTAEVIRVVLERLRSATSADFVTLTLFDEDRRQAQELADRVAVAVSSAQRDEQLYMQAHFDPLTGLPNRLLFKDRVDREIARSERLKMGFAILVVDLDHFKTVNDSFGHTMCDSVLREAGRPLYGCIRWLDTVSRFRCDECAVLFTA